MAEVVTMAVKLDTDYTRQIISATPDDTEYPAMNQGDVVLDVTTGNEWMWDGSDFQPMLPLMPMYFNAVTGAYYPRILKQDLTKYESASSYGTRRWYKCTNMAEAYVGGVVGTSTLPSYTFGYCSGLVKLVLPDIKNVPNNFAPYCTALEEVILGDVSKPITSIGSNSFDGCTQSGLTITVYVTPGTQPLSNSPWGATNATIIYRSSVTGDIIT